MSQAPATDLDTLRRVLAEQRIEVADEDLPSLASGLCELLQRAAVLHELPLDGVEPAPDFHAGW